MAVAVVLWCHTGQLLIRTVSLGFSGGFAQDHDQAVCDAMFGQDHARGPFLDAPVRARSCHVAPSAWEDWASRAHFGPVSLLIGPAGPIAWQWSKHATPLSLPESLGRFTPVACLEDVQVCALALGAVGIEFPSWSSLADGARPLPARGDVQDQPRSGWQREVSMQVEQHFRDTRLMPTMTEPDQSLLRSQGGPLAVAPFTSCPTDGLFRIEPQCFRVLLLRRLRLPLPLSQLNCRCGRPFDVLGHHRAACATAMVLGRRGFALESVVARICREGGARVTMFVRDMDLRDFDRLDGRRLEEVIADGLPLFGGAQLAIEATLVSAIKRDDVPGVVGGKMEDVAWLSSVAKWQDDGLPRLASS